MKKKWIGFIVVILTLVITACSNNSSPSTSNSPGTSPENTNTPDNKKEEQTLRIAMVSPGEGLIKVWEDIAAQFESTHENIKVSFTYQDDETYQSIGLPNLLNGKNAPDLYFEWAGQRLANRIQEGFAADITQLLADSGLGEQFADGSFNGMIADGKTYAVPVAGDITNVMFYNKQIFENHSITPPKTWDEFLAICEKLKDAGVTPIVAGNLDLWPGGNWLAHQISRVVGEEAYSKALLLEQPFNTPDFVQAFGYVKQLWDNGYVNKDVNAIGDEEADMQFLNGIGAMHPIGSWLVPTAVEEGSEVELGYFNIPAMPDGKGNQDSIIAVLNGMVVNEKSALKEEAIAFMKLYSSKESSHKLAEAGAVPITLDGIDEATMNPLSIALNDLMENSPAVISPPDTGYDLEVADAFNMAISQVLGGAKSPEAALEQLEATLAPLK